MKLSSMAEQVAKKIRQRGIRSWLTMLGMVIGVAAIFSLLSISLGVNEEVAKQLEMFGSDTIIVYNVPEQSIISSGGGLLGASGRITKKDTDSVRTTIGVKTVTRALYDRESISYKGENISLYVVGYDASVFEQFSVIKAEKGRLYEEGERGVVVVGSSVAKDYFKDEIKVNSQIVIENKTFTVVGILEEQRGLSTEDMNSYIIIPYEDAELIMRDAFREGDVYALVITVDESFSTKEVAENIKYKIAANHRVDVDEPDFSVITMETTAEMVGSIIGVVNAVLSFTGGIAVVVGAIGIANSMFMSVVERRKEIGIMRAIGARKQEVEMMFLMESAALGLLAGMAGVLISGALLYAGSLVGVPVVFSPLVFLATVLGSMAIGTIAGFVPAKQATEVNPVEAMHYDF
ncbi:MAG: ABC transporter permease [Candidatus Anstonellales archaeon]